MATHMNPGHPACRQLTENWEVVMASLVYLMGGTVEITLDELAEIGEFLSKNTMTVNISDRSIRLGFVDGETAEKLAKQHGGMPN